MQYVNIGDMANNTTIKFNAKNWGNAILKTIVEEQTRRLIEYAPAELARMVETKELGNATYNVQDSFVWGVYYNGKRVPKGFGFYGNKTARKNSYLHEYSRNPIPVNGRALARTFIKNYTPSTDKGWEIVWAVCAPYAAYWEGGHVNPPKSGRVVYAHVMFQRYDSIKSELGEKCKLTMRMKRPS